MKETSLKRHKKQVGNLPGFGRKLPKRSKPTSKGTKGKLGTYRASEGNCLNEGNQPKKAQKASWELAGIRKKVA
ncbi:MAG: hypothetical protein K6G65_01590 [Lachnospiraceae bacterium]|nr:hypothetical protein [Lachnospiraceae bacterium]